MFGIDLQWWAIGLGVYCIVLNIYCFLLDRLTLWENDDVVNLNELVRVDFWLRLTGVEERIEKLERLTSRS